MSKPLPETLRKIQERKEKESAEYIKKRDVLAQEAQARAERILERSKKYAQELVANEKAIIEAKNKAAAEGAFYVPAEAKVALVIRIRGLNGIDPRTRKILQLFRLRQRLNAVFIRINKATLEMLKRVESYVAYGYPSPEVVRQLIFKRGFAAVNGQRLPLTSTIIAYATFRKVSELNSAGRCDPRNLHIRGPNFTVANRFLWPFQLNTPKGGFRQPRRHYVEGGDYGNREDLIDQLVLRMI
ncbi:60S ribosomal protein L7-2 [Histomonas meleagridis]|nr:60S ribosomal protein L7-2 [Histomonas meleagridis]